MTPDFLQAVTALAVLIVMVMTKYEAVKAARKLAVVHALVNSSMLEQKKLTWLALASVAELSNTESNIKRADEAEKIYRNHLEQQQKMEVAK